MTVWLIGGFCFGVIAWPPVMAVRQVRRERRALERAELHAWYERERAR